MMGATIVYFFLISSCILTQKVPCGGQPMFCYCFTIWNNNTKKHQKKCSSCFTIGVFVRSFALSSNIYYLIKKKTTRINNFILTNKQKNVKTDSVNMNNKPIKFKHVRFLIYICQRLGLDMYIICIFIYYMYLLSFWIVVIIVIIIKIRRDSLNLTIFIYVVFLVSIYICVFRLRYYDFHLYFNVEKKIDWSVYKIVFFILNFQTSILEF